MAHRQRASAARDKTPDHAARARAGARHELREQRRLEREREAARRLRVARVQRAGALGVGIVVVAIVIVLVVRAATSAHSPASATTQQPIPGVVSYTGLARTHTTAPVTYPQTPPVGGPHDPVWQNCGIYTTPVRNENAVHSLEHGAVWLTYRPDLPAASVRTLQSLVAGHNHTLLSPYPGLPSPVVISAWGLQLQVQSASDPRLAEFIARYANGTQAPEPGGECTGGVGTPAQTPG